jgi:hypothetical protein
MEVKQRLYSVSRANVLNRVAMSLVEQRNMGTSSRVR